MKMKILHLLIIFSICLSLAFASTVTVTAFGVSLFGSLSLDQDASQPIATARSPYQMFPASSDQWKTTSCGPQTYYWNASLIFGVGSNYDGSLGINSTNFDDTRAEGPQLITFFEESGILIQSVSCSPTVVIVTSSDGDIYGWGSNVHRLLNSDGAFASFSSPVKIAFSFSEKVVKLSMGRDHVLALTDSGTVFCWGSNRYRQCGMGGSIISPPTIVPLPPNVTDIAAGESHSIALVGTPELNQIYGWGFNHYGQVCLTSLALFAETPLVEIPTLLPMAALYGRNVVKVFNNRHGSFFLSEEGRLFGCGLNSGGAMGFGMNTLYVDRPREVPLGPGYAVKDVFVSSIAYHSLISTSDLSLFGTGANSAQQLGLSSIRSTRTFVNLTFINEPVVDASISDLNSIVSTSSSISRPSTIILPPQCQIQGCSCPAPLADAICVDGNWTAPNLVLFEDVVLNGSIIIVGNITFGPGSSVSIPFGKTVEVRGCTQFYGGVIQLNASTEQLGDLEKSELYLINSTCGAGNPQVNLTVINPDSCNAFVVDKVVQGTKGLLVLFKNNRCSPPKKIWPLIVAISVVVALVIAVLIVVFAVPKIRMCVFPFYKRRLMEKQRADQAVPMEDKKAYGSSDSLI